MSIEYIRTALHAPGKLEHFTYHMGFMSIRLLRNSNMLYYAYSDAASLSLIVFMRLLQMRIADLLQVSNQMVANSI